ncbi:unnamed protein product [Hermetia illucens]|uniref:Ionotropic receptor n=1 Tax=Hermetia illucens TaxID=343691 RepID=A0A7R8UGX1_HERIL|nr:unnamed protein product [Hermetia illucens]
MSNQLLQELHRSLSVPIIHYSNLWRPPRNINPYKHGKVVLAKFKRNFLLIAITDAVAARDALSKQIFALTYRNPIAKVIFFLAENTTMETTTFQALIRKCFDSDVVDVVFFQNQDPPRMFTYHPFNDFQIIKLRKVSDFFANRLMNLNNYPLKVVICDVPPKVMKSHDGKKVIGYASHMIESYVQKRNASIEVIPSPEELSVYESVQDNLVTRQMDVFWGLLPIYHYEIGEPSYPLLYEKFCAMVPAPKVIPIYRNFLLPFEENVWIAVICGTFYIAIVTYIVGAIVNGRKDLSAALITSICFIIARGEVGIFSNLNRRLFVIYVLLFLLGFMLSNMYCAFLTTFLTTPSYESELRTLDDIAAADESILIENFNSHALLVQQSGLLSYWKTNTLFEASQSGYVDLKKENKEFGPIQLTLIHLQIAFYILLSGLAISLAAFIAEHLCYYLIKLTQN